MNCSSNQINFYLSSVNPLPVEVQNKLYAIDREFFPYPWPLSDWQNYLNQYPYSAVVLSDELGLVLGFTLIFGTRGDDVAHLVKIVTLPDQRQRGLAWAMLDFWEAQQALCLEHRSLYLEVEKSNTAAINFYHKRQFLVLRPLKDFYGPGRDGQAMAQALDNKQNT
jgi:ribosomal protein S18 acetylase RimI-like enzyme